MWVWLKWNWNSIGMQQRIKRWISIATAGWRHLLQQCGIEHDRHTKGMKRDRTRETDRQTEHRGGVQHAYAFVPQPFWQLAVLTMHKFNEWTGNRGWGWARGECCVSGLSHHLPAPAAASIPWCGWLNGCACVCVSVCCCLFLHKFAIF